MQFTAPRDALLALLAPGVGLTVKQNSAPVLAHVLLDVSKGGVVSATGTNLMATMTRTLQVIQAIPGAACAPGRGLVKILTLMPAGDVRLTSAPNNYLTIESLVPKKKVSVKLLGMSASDRDIQPLPRPV